MLLNNYLSFFFLFLLLFPSVAHADNQSRTTLAVYMIGSDLEYDPSLSPSDNVLKKSGATRDIAEMVSGWGNGTKDVNFIVGYGGSKKKGWEGLTVATIDDLKKDLEDQVIGNSDDYYQGWEERNMASAVGVSRFLEYIVKVYPESRLILIIWDHGAAWEGCGRDSNYEGSTMSPEDLKEALQSLGKPVDLIGFDACFMANLEYLRVIAPYGKYAIASEETEPEHGWDYIPLISSLKENPGIPPEELGKVIVDSYLDNPNHQKGALSLSVLDLSQMPNVLASLDNLALSLDDTIGESGSYQVISRLAGDLSGIGVSKDSEGNDVELMVDLIALTEKSGIEIPAVKTESQACTDALKEFVVYSRSDSPVTQISGIGLFSPVMASHPVYYEKIEPGTVLDLTSGWTRFITSLAKQIRFDNTPPKLIPESNGFRIIEDGYASVTDVYYQIRSDGSKVVLAQEPPFNATRNWASAPQWGGTGSFLTDGSSSSLLPGYYVETNDLGVQLYYAWGDLIQGKKRSLVRMDLWYDPTTGALKWIMRPYTINAKGEQEFERSTATPSPGDYFVVYSIVIDPSGSITWEEIGKVKWSKEMRVNNLKMPCGEYGLQSMAIDLAGNTGETDIVPYSIPCISE